MRFTQLQTLASTARSGSPNAATPVRIRDAMATHYAELCAQSAAAYTGDRQRAWLTAIDQEHDNLRAALDWAVANDDAETALTIAGGASWPHWLAGHGDRGQALARRRLRVRGRGRRTHAGAGADRPRAPRLPRRCPRALRRRPGSRARDLPTPRRRRVDGVGVLVLRRAARRPGRHRRGAPAPAGRCSTSTASRPTDPFAIAARVVLARRSSRSSTATSPRPSVHYRAAAEGFARLDRPVMISMCLGMVADFDERAGDYPRRDHGVGGRDRDQRRRLLGGFTGSLLARLGWALLHDGDVDARRGGLPAGARLGAPGAQHAR